MMVSPEVELSTSKKVLLVISDPESAQEIKAQVVRSGLSAHVAATGRQALGAVAEDDYAVALIADTLPDSDSFGLVSQLRQHSTGEPVPSVMLLKDRDDQAAVTALRCGAEDAIAIDRLAHEDLEARIDAVMERARSENLFQSELLNADLLTLEAQKRQGQILERLDDIVHAIKTPLGAINEFVSLALDGVGGPVSEKTGKFLAHARGACWTLDREIERLHELASLDGAITSDDGRRTDLGMVVQFVLECLEPYARHRYATLSSLCEPDLPAVETDRFYVSQILLRLAAHAIEAAGNGGAVSIELQRTDLHVVVSVRLHHCDPVKQKVEFLHDAKPRNNFLQLPQLQSCEQLLRSIRSHLSYEDDGVGGGVFTFELPRANTEVIKNECT